MNNKKKRMAFITVIIVIFSTTMFLLFICNENNVLLEQNEDFIDLIQEEVVAGNEVNFSELVEGEWDEMFIIRPYDDLRDAFKREGKKWRKIDNSIEYRDHITLLVFLKDDKIVSYVNYPRKYGDFLEGGILERHSTIFKPEKAHDEEWFYLCPID